MKDEQIIKFKKLMDSKPYIHIPERPFNGYGTIKAGRTVHLVGGKSVVVSRVEGDTLFYEISGEEFSVDKSLVTI